MSVELAWKMMDAAFTAPSGTMLRRIAGAAVVLAMVVHCGGCSYIEMVRRHRRLAAAFEEQPRLGLVQELAPGQSLQIIGGLQGDPDRVAPLAIIAVSQQYAHNEIVAWRIVPGSVGYYEMLLPQGQYDLLVLTDLNHDGFFGGDEVVGRTPVGAPFDVDAVRAVNGFTLDGPTLRLNYDAPTTEELPVPIKVVVTSQVVASLDDEFFDPGYGVMGLYNPSKFLEHTQGYFFGLEPLDVTKTQLLFVHGITGTPRDWKFLVEGIDRSRFQPWFFYYPSGLPLDRSAAILAEFIQRAAAHLKVERLVVVAHSMGGLVALSALHRLATPKAPAYLKMYISLSTPYGGHDAAGLAVEYASDVIPSWQDIAPGSLFLRTVAGARLPPEVPFFLLFSYNDPGRIRLGPCNDGTVTVRSELNFPQQREALHSYGFDETHMSILASPAVRDVFNELITPAAPPQGLLDDPLGTVKRVFTKPFAAP